MDLTTLEKNTIHQYLDRFCNEVDIDQDNGTIRVDIAGNLIKVTPNKYGELEFKTNNMLLNDTHDAGKIMMVLEYLNDYMCYMCYICRRQMNLSVEPKLSVNLKVVNLSPCVVIQHYENNDYPLNYFQVGQLIYMLIKYLKAHNNTNIPKCFTASIHLYAA